MVTGTECYVPATDATELTPCWTVAVSEPKRCRRLGKLLRKLGR